MQHFLELPGGRSLNLLSVRYSPAACWVPGLLWFARVSDPCRLLCALDHAEFPQVLIALALTCDAEVRRNVAFSIGPRVAGL